MYSPRARFGAEGGEVFGGWMSASVRGMNVGARLLITFPTSVHSASGALFRIGASERRNEMMATMSSSLMSPYGIIGRIDARPLGFTEWRIIRAISWSE